MFVRLQLLRLPGARYFGNPVKGNLAFSDRVRIRACGGKGGAGVSCSERGLKGTLEYPTGANGGKGGDVYLVASPDLMGFQFDRHVFRGGDGKRANKGSRKGRCGADICVQVPVGTVVHEVLGKDENQALDTEVLVDLDKPDSKYLVAKGGDNGRGNMSFRTSYRMHPTWSSSGALGETHELLLELKLIADVGLVGFPNAGKSSLLCAVSNASPQVAAYPFTTLRPTVGIVHNDDINRKSFSVADIPGLIEGAHQNKGLGHAFLRHVERTKVLLFVLDLAGSEGRDPLTDFKVLREELSLYKHSLLSRPALIFANKQDLRPSLSFRRHLRRLKQVTDLPVICGSAKTGQNIDELVQALREVVEEHDRNAVQATEAELREEGSQ